MKLPPSQTRVEIVVPVHDALEYALRCLESMALHPDGFDVGVIVVDDGSTPETAGALATLCASKPRHTLIRHDVNIGYTRAVNSGLKASTAPFVVLLNSDTLVTRGWLTGMMLCMAASPSIGLVGPLSNAGGWQNVPRLLNDDGSYAVNDLPAGMTPAEMASVVASAATRIHPRVPAINGFCMMISRRVIDRVGWMDEDAFPVGYGEETDYCLRASDLGFEIAIADDAYVFHAKSKSFGHGRRQELSAAGDKALRLKHTPERVGRLLRQLADTIALNKIRGSVQRKLRQDTLAIEKPRQPMGGILFLLPVGAGGGGGHSVVQEVVAMRAQGVVAKIAVINVNRPVFLETYADAPNVDEMFVGYHSDEHFVSVAAAYRVVVATICSSVRLVQLAHRSYPYILPAYYVQDYEPFFFKPGSADWKIALESYTLMPQATLFAKTWWLVDEVASRHGVPVHKVLPSVDHDVYHPGRKHKHGKIRIVAMIRPDSPRRGAARTMRVLKQIAWQFRGQCLIHLFGCRDADPAFVSLSSRFTFHNHGILSRPQVGKLLGRCDVFVDLSDYQAFGRTGIEAMACTCAVIVPKHGGTAEYAVDGENSVVVDSTDEKQCLAAIGGLIADPTLLRTMQAKARQAALRFSAEAAASSELALFADQIERMRLPGKSPLNRAYFALRHLLGRKLRQSA